MEAGNSLRSKHSKDLQQRPGFLEPRTCKQSTYGTPDKFLHRFTTSCSHSPKLFLTPSGCASVRSLAILPPGWQNGVCLEGLRLQGLFQSHVERLHRHAKSCLTSRVLFINLAGTLFLQQPFELGPESHVHSYNNPPGFELEAPRLGPVPSGCSAGPVTP